MTPGWYRVHRHVHVGPVQEAFGVEADAPVPVQVDRPCQEHVEVVVGGEFRGCVVREVRGEVVDREVEGVRQRARRNTARG